MSVKDEPTEANVKRGGQRESYGDFMSYYIMDGDDAEDEPPAKTSKPPAPVKEKPRRKAKAKQPAAPPAPTPPALPAVNAQSQDQSQPSKMPPPQQTSRSNPAPQQVPIQKPMPAPPVPRQQVPPQSATRPPHMPTPAPAPPPEPPVLEEIRVKYHAAVPEKVKKLQALSTALTNFGGVPPTAKSPVPEKKEIKKKEPSKSDGLFQLLVCNVFDADIFKAPVDDLLAMFDDDDSDSKDEAESPSPVEEPRFLEHTGDPDGPLTYGIQFIMNALKSWAQQRLHQQQLAAMHQAQMPPPSIPGSRNPGSGAPLSANLTPLRQLNLSDTPEGQAIAAFRDVVESGCLQVNVVMPADLASAVRHLYVQIDHLINQGSKSQPEPWQCMSYGAQIEAHAYRVKRWKDQQMRAQEEMARQQEFAQHQMMQMGGQPVYNGRSHHPQFHQQGHQTSERRRSTPLAQSSNRHPPRVSLPVNVDSLPPHGTPPANRMGQGSYGPPDSRNGPRHVPNGAHNDNVSLLMANLLPRSGQTMKFSFAPSNEAAIQAFGAGAFPAMGQNQNQNMPNRGPLSASPAVRDPSAPAPPTERPRLTSEGSDARRTSNHRETNSAEAHAHPAPEPKPTSGFTAVNVPRKLSNSKQRSISAEQRRSSKGSHSDAVMIDD